MVLGKGYPTSFWTVKIYALAKSDRVSAIRGRNSLRRSVMKCGRLCQFLKGAPINRLN
ncbi:hypothetical protein [Chlorogloea sp. CCALA 695]|uniref:hypothetical protein n=1 Tax=Chlorogloea sp. CCALA 695 TaxID=2107693 RepID=UPI001304BAFF|nr:hypothetical protein [Chlorogloea sp. CCALA 695]